MRKCDSGIRVARTAPEWINRCASPAHAAANRGARVAAPRFLGISLSSTVKSAGQYLRSKRRVVVISGGHTGVADRQGGHMRNIMRAALFAISFAGAGEAAADCVCRCVNGELGAICVGSTAVPPVCAPRACPATTQNTPPRLAQSSPPAGTTQCLMVQVLNPKSGRYDWQELCK